MEWFKQLVDKIKVDLSKMDLLCMAKYVSFALIIYFLIPMICITEICEKLTDNKLINITIMIFVISMVLYFFKSIICGIISIVKRKSTEIKEKKVLGDELNSLDLNCISIMQEFYIKETKRFKKRTKLLPKTEGMDVLEYIGIIEFDDYVDVEGGYSITKKQHYIIKEKYFKILDKMSRQKRKAKFMDCIENL